MNEADKTALTCDNKGELSPRSPDVNVGPNTACGGQGP